MGKIVKTFRLDKDILKRVEAMAETENRTLNNMVETLLKRHTSEPVKIRLKK